MSPQINRVAERSLANIEFSPVFGSHGRSTANTVVAGFVSDTVRRASLQTDLEDEQETQDGLSFPRRGSLGMPPRFAGRRLAGTLALPLREEFTLTVIPQDTRVDYTQRYVCALRELALCGSFWSAAEECNGSAAFPFRSAFQDKKESPSLPFIGVPSFPAPTSNHAPKPATRVI
jgi:hypothetical protein